MNIKQKIKEQAVKVANINARSRELDRKEARDLKEINDFFNSLTLEFYKIIFTIPFDEQDLVLDIDGAIVKAGDLDPFKDFNAQWLDFCNRWNASKKHLIKANENAFKDLCIDNTKSNQNDKPLFITNNQLVHLSWAL